MEAIKIKNNVKNNIEECNKLIEQLKHHFGLIKNELAELSCDDNVESLCKVAGFESEEEVDRAIMDVENAWWDTDTVKEDLNLILDKVK